MINNLILSMILKVQGETDRYTGVWLDWGVEVFVKIDEALAVTDINDTIEPLFQR